MLAENASHNAGYNDHRSGDGNDTAQFLADAHSDGGGYGFGKHTDIKCVVAAKHTTDCKYTQEAADCPRQYGNQNHHRMYSAMTAHSEAKEQDLRQVAWRSEEAIPP